MRSRVFLIFILAFSLVAYAATEWNPMLFKSAVDIEAGPLTVGGVTPNAASLLELQSTTQGSIFAPKMTTVQRDAIATPPSGLTIFNTDSDAYNFYDGASWTEIGSGAGGGAGLTYYDDFDADDINNLTEFDDTAVGGDLTGGSAANLAVTSNTTTPINKIASYRISKSGADASWEGVNISFSGTEIDELAKSGRPFIFSFNYETSANYNAGTEAVSVYYFRVGTDSAAQACNGRTLGGSVSNTLGVATTAQSFSCSFNLASTTTAVRIAWVVTGTGTSTWDLDIDNIYFGPDFQVPGVVQYYQEIPLDGSNNFTNGTIIVTRTGNQVSIRVTETVTFSSNSAPESAAGLIPEWARPNTANIENVTRMNASFVAYMLVETDGTLSFSFRDWAGSLLAQTSLAAQAGISYAIVDNSSASLSTTQVDQQTHKVKITKSTSQAIATTAATKWTFDTTDFDNASLFDNANDRITVKAAGTYAYDFIGYASNMDTSTLNLYLYKNGNAVNRVLNKDGGDERDVTFSGTINLVAGDYLEIYSTTGTDTSYNAGSSSQLVQFSVTQVPDFSTFGVFGLYEYTEAEVSALNYTVSSDTYVDATGGSITLTPGTWQVCYEGSVYLERASTSPGNGCKTVLRDGSNNDINGTARLSSIIQDSVFASFVSPVSACAEVTISSSTTYKMSLKNNNAAAVTRCTFWPGGSNYAGGITDPDSESKIWARRMK